MKNTITSNLIQFAVYHDIKEVDHEKVSLCLVHDDTIYRSSYQLSPLDGNSLWVYLVRDLKIDKTTIHLFENFCDAIDKEDYDIAAIMKREILNRWICPSEDYLLEKGAEYLSKLKIGIQNSSIFKHLVDSVDELAQKWNQKGFQQTHYIIEQLLIISNEFNMYDFDEVVDEAFASIRSEYTHPILTVENSIELFRVLVRSESDCE